MKMTKTLALAAIVASSLVAAGTLSAQEAPKEKPHGEQHHGGPGGPGGPNAHGMADMMEKMLKLTDEQKPKVKAIMEDTQQKMQALRTDTKIAPEDKAAKAKELRDATNVKLKEVLTAEQYAKWEKMGPGARRGPPGAPPVAPPAKAKAPAPTEEKK